MFLGGDVRDFFPRHGSLPHQPEAGKSWRQLLLNYVQSTAGTISGTNIRDWIVLLIGMEVDEYVRSMRVLVGRDTWGGFMQASSLRKAWSGLTGTEFHVIMFEHVQVEDGTRGFRPLSCCGSNNPESQRVCLAWQGTHWICLRLGQRGKQMIQEWMSPG